jgi:acyl carrier protein
MHGDPTSETEVAELPETTGDSRGGISATESVLLDIWMHVFRNKEIGIDDDFYELGGHSLIATRIIAMIRARLGKRLRFKELFEYRTIAKMTAFLDNGEDT